MATKAEMMGQRVLDGVGNTEPQAINLTEQQVFLKVAVPQLWGVEPRALSPEDHFKIGRLSSGFLLPSLVGVGSEVPNAVGYVEGESQHFVRVVLSPEEYSAMTISPRRLGERAVNATLRARSPRENFSVDQDAAKRAGVHVVTKALEKLEPFTTTLDEEYNLLTRFSEYVRNPEKRRLRGDNLRVQMTWFLDHIYGEIFTVLREQRGWDTEKYNSARSALTDRLFLDRNNNQHLKNWQDSLHTAEVYWGNKRALFKTKEAEAKAVIAGYSGEKT